MGRPKGWASDRTGRPAMRSPGRPPVGRREHRQRFWAAIARGATSIEAAAGLGCRAWWVSDGFGRVAACRRSLRRRRRAGICPSPSARRSRSCTPPAVGCGRSPVSSVGHRRRSLVSCVAMRPAWRPSGLSSLDGAVACRPARPTSQAGEAGGQRRAASVCAGPSLRGGQAAGRERGGGSGGPLGWSSSWPSQGPAMGQGVES